MSYSAIPKTYASAFVDASSSPEEAEQELGSIVSILNTESQFRDFFDTPSVKRDVKETVLVKILQGKVSEITLNFLQVLLRRGRFSYLSEIHEALKEELDRKAGRIRAKVRSYPALDESSLNKLREALKERFKSEFILENQEDPSLIGGFVVRFQDLAIDGSMKSQLGKVRQSLLDSKLPIGVVYEN
ncbi:ATP synthase F1 subunit delta [Leptospira wolffii]|uniref:ATP synthase subunit delta n=1 Tax=Leptospira wolffii TaxID=409998 RepID=A0A2M9Z857_9LEPT|nr:ATP synthase F1 subunit delta [Leptospira wolffii]EPG67581.1 ATP synthase F1, delta subunit [Leptospira wolffii serovar Khorat str. Khorat-H2]PJZ64605.1 ATP synthase F1 subunit delta [Leptospira wolffii]TGK55149.1 ATP synthase F1 subunit delta [Leptospira wolffii]TGK70550.1 ATP synthase F1 subunit delta [Leptospira wolffii]TGK77602.1 ATP synthase F1 subunit delta [Leptospira wolffii]